METRGNLAKTTILVSGGLTLAGVGNYLFNLLMTRMLGPSEYGILAALVSIVYFFGIFSQTINLTICKFTVQLQARAGFETVRRFLGRAIKKIIWIAGTALVFFGAFSFLIRDFLHLSSYWPGVVLAVILFFSLIHQYCWED